MSASTLGKNTSSPSLLNNILAWWGLHELAGNSRADSTGLAVSLTEGNGSPTTFAAALNIGAQAAVFVGTTGPRLSANWTPPASITAWTVSVWVYPINPALAGNAVFSLTDGVSKYATLTYAINTGAASYADTSGQHTAGNLVPGAWTHLVASNDNVNTRVYNNGVLQYLGATGGVGSISNATKVGIGTNPTNFAISSNGNFAAALCGVWSRALTDGGLSVGQMAPTNSEIGMLYNGGLGVDYPFTAAA